MTSGSLFLASAGAQERCVHRCERDRFPRASKSDGWYSFQPK